MSYNEDAGESLFFQSELRHVEREMFEQPIQGLKSRSFVPTIEGVDPALEVYTWRELTHTGLAQLITAGSTDLPRANAYGAEYNATVKRYGASFEYDIFEIEKSRTTGRGIDRARANAARQAFEIKIDEVLAVGDSLVGTKGLLNQSNTTSFTPATKSGGGTSWGTVGVPAATGKEMVADVAAAIDALQVALKDNQMFTSFELILPTTRYNVARSTNYGNASDVNVLQYLKNNFPELNSISPWQRAENVSGGGTKMVLYVRNVNVIGALVPQELRQHPPEPRNFSRIINLEGTCGGAVSKFPIGIVYGAGI